MPELFPDALLNTASCYPVDANSGSMSATADLIREFTETLAQELLKVATLRGEGVFEFLRAPYLPEKPALDNNIYRFGRFSGVMTILALTKTVEKFYDIVTHYEDDYDQDSPAKQTEVYLDLDNKVDVWIGGFFHLEDKVSKTRLVLRIEASGARNPYYAIKSIKGSQQAKLFQQRLEEIANVEDIFRNKTFSFERSEGSIIPKFIRTEKVTREKVILEKDIMDQVDDNILQVFLNPEKYRNFNIPTKRGVILEGPPGTGKSTLLKYLNTELEGKVTFMYVTDGTVTSDSDLEDVFSFARKYQPCLVAIEDLDTIGQRRDSGSAPFTSELLAQLDGLESINHIVMVATTNNIELIDEAIKNRPSRFDRRLKIDLPKDDCRQHLLERFLQERKIPFKEEDLSRFVKRTRKFSGAHLEEATITAQMIAMREETECNGQHVDQAIKFLGQQFHEAKIGANSQERTGFRSNHAE